MAGYEMINVHKKLNIKAPFIDLLFFELMR